jgi:hypothetical protein
MEERKWLTTQPSAFAKTGLMIHSSCLVNMESAKMAISTDALQAMRI